MNTFTLPSAAAGVNIGRMRIHEAPVFYPEQGGMLTVALPAMPSDSPAVSGRVAKIMPAGPGEQPITMVLPAKFKGISVQGPGDGGGTWTAMFECEPISPMPGEPAGETRVQVFTLW